MFERFTDRARKVMALANQEAQRLNHEYVGPEHIFLALLKEGTGVAFTVLGNLGIDLCKARLEVYKLVAPGPDMVIFGKLPQQPRAKVAVQHRAAGNNYVGTEHLLLGLLHDIDSVAYRLLLGLGLTVEKVREEVATLVGPVSTPAEPKLVDVFGAKLTVEQARAMGEHLIQLAAAAEGKSVAMTWMVAAPVAAGGGQ